MVGAYAPFANGGLAIVPHVIERITTAKGTLLYAYRNEDFRIVDPRTVAMMNEMLEQTLTIGTAKQASLPGWTAAGKTGTSQDFRDAWFIGYTPHLVTGVWLGNDDGTPTKHVTGGGLPVEVWSRFMRNAHQGVPVASLPTARSGGLLSGLFGGAAPAPPTEAPRRDRPARSGRSPPTIRVPPMAAAVSTTGCSIICSGAAETRPDTYRSMPVTDAASVRVGAKRRSLIQHRDCPHPTSGRRFDFEWEARHHEAGSGQLFQIIKLFHLAIRYLDAGVMAFPND